MKKTHLPSKKPGTDKMGYNEKNPGQSQGAFPPDANAQQRKSGIKSNAADKKQKEDQN
jgi:hypothetical protein